MNFFSEWLCFMRPVFCLQRLMHAISRYAGLWLCIMFCIPAGINPANANECEANFDYFQDESHPLAIQFVDISSGIYSWWEWDFGDGQTSNLQNPLHTYQTPGIYEICLTISSPTKECLDTYCMKIPVPVPGDCHTTFTWEQAPEFPFAVSFISQPGPDVEFFAWDFGDGNTSLLANPVHTYGDTGIFVVSLTATNHHNPVNCNSVYYDTVIVRIEPCISSFMMIPSPTNPMEVTFIATPAGTVNSYYWNFGDGRTSIEPNPVHIFTDTGFFEVCLTVSNYYYTLFCSHTSCQTIKVSIDRCMADFFYEQDSIYPLKYKFYNTSSGVLSGFLWDFGDGQTSTEINPLHSYMAPGNYTVWLKVRNLLYPELCTDSVSKVVSTGSLECTAEISWMSDSLRPLDIKFFSIASGNPDYLLWDFGDGTTSAEPHPFHSFPDTGTYQVTLLVLNTAYSSYCYDLATLSLEIKLTHKPVADFEIRFDSLSSIPNLFHFKDRSRGNKIQAWQWAFGDGTGSNAQNPSHQYPPMQWFNVCLTIADFLPPKYTLTAKKCKSLQSKSYFDIGGSVFDGAFPINNPQHKDDTAIVSLYRVYPGPFVLPVRSGKFHKLGYYWFSPVLSGEYIVKAELTKGSAQAGNFFPTYAIQSLLWQKADPVSLYEDVFDADIRLVTKPNIGTGPCSIRGKVIHTSDPTTIYGEPATQTPVFLTDDFYRFLDFTLTDSLGAFAFERLPFGTYFLIPDASGLFYTQDTAVLSNQVPSNNDILLKIWNTASLSVEVLPGTAQLQVSPNPAGNEMILQYSLPIAAQVYFEIINLNGQNLMQFSHNGRAGINRVILDISRLASGIYILKMDAGNRGKGFTKIIKR